MQPMSLLSRATLLASGVPAILGLYAFGVVLPKIATVFHALPNATLLSQMVGAVVGLSFALSAPLIGRLVQNLGYRKVYFWSSLAFALSGASVLFLNSLYAVLLTRVSVGVSVAGVAISAVTGISMLPERERAQLFGLQTAFGGFLGVICYMAVAKLAAIGWRVPFALHLLSLILLPFIWMLPKPDLPLRQSHPQAAPDHPKASVVGPLAGLTIPFILLAIYTGMTGLMPPLFAPFYLASLGIHNPTLVALPLMAAAAAATIAALCYGWILERVGINGVFALCLCFTGAGAGASGFSSTLGFFVVAQMVMSIGLAFSLANLNAAAVVIAPLNASRALSLVGGVYYGAQALLPFAAQAIGRVAGPGGVFEGFAVIGLIWAAAYVFVIKKERHQQPHLKESL